MNHTAGIEKGALDGEKRDAVGDFENDCFGVSDNYVFILQWSQIYAVLYKDCAGWHFPAGQQV